MNLYSLHSNPEVLHGFDIAPYKLPAVAYIHAMNNPKLRPKLEPIIMKDPEYVFLYAHYVLKRRWPEAEPYIMKDPASATHYAEHVLKRPWPEAEPYIMKDPYHAFWYADIVLNDIWPEAEPYIMKDERIWTQYKLAFNL